VDGVVFDKETTRTQKALGAPHERA